MTDDHESPDLEPEPEPESAAEAVVDIEAIAVEKVPVEEVIEALDDEADDDDDTSGFGDAERERDAKRAIEAVVLATIEPVEARLLAQLVEIPVATVERLCAELAAEYEEQGRGFVLAEVAGGYRYQTHTDLAPYVERFVLEGQHARLSAPALETLAIIAYKQPISRGQMSAIRGVNVEATLNTLLQRGYVMEVGRDPGPGAAVLYGTTRTFLERLGLSGLDELPALGDFVPDPSVVEALERGLRITASGASPDAASETDASAEADASASAAGDGESEDEAGTDSESPDSEPDAAALLADDPVGPLD